MSSFFMKQLRIIRLLRNIDMVSVKTKEDIPKGKIFDCVKALKGIEVPAPVHIGDVILKNVADTGVDIVATKNVE